MLAFHILPMKVDKSSKRNQTKPSNEHKSNYFALND